MKRFLSVVMVVFLLAMTCVGCGKKDRVLYKEKLSKHIKLAKYEQIVVDTSSKEYKETYKDVISLDVYNYDLYVKTTEGVVKDGDNVNIDYVGKKDGVAFEGGTAENYNLLIGSDSFIDGFEDGLIGKNIGSTVNLNLTFPKDYGSEELAGKAVVFTVKINYVKSDVERKPEEYYKELDFDTYEDYAKDLKERAVKDHIIKILKDTSEIESYPEADAEIIYKAYKNILDSEVQNNYGVNLQTYLQYMNQSEDDFKKEIIEDQIHPIMDEQMVLYSIFDKEKMELDKNLINERINEKVKQYNTTSVTADTIINFYGEYYFEYSVIYDEVVEFLYKNVKIS